MKRILIGVIALSISLLEACHQVAPSVRADATTSLGHIHDEASRQLLSKPDTFKPEPEVLRDSNGKRLLKLANGTWFPEPSPDDPHVVTESTDSFNLAKHPELRPDLPGAHPIGHRTKGRQLLSHVAGHSD
jgi:hypothetical protein